MYHVYYTYTYRGIYHVPSVEISNMQKVLGLHIFLGWIWMDLSFSLLVDIGARFQEEQYVVQCHHV